MEATHNIQSLRLSRDETFCSLKEQETNLRSLTFQAGTRAHAPWYCCYIMYIQTHYLITDIKMMFYVFLLVSISWLAKRFKLLIFMTLTMYYIGLKTTFFLVLICVVKTHLHGYFPQDD